MNRVLALGATLLLAMAGAAQAQPPSLSKEVRTWRLAHEREIVGNLADFTAIPSVAANPAGLSAMAERLQGELQKRGFQTRQLSAGPGIPNVVFGQFSTPGAKRTAVFYAHYDGQPVTPSEWRGDPFTPVMRASGEATAADVDWRVASGPMNPEWRLYGRAANDDKSSIVAFLAAFDALSAAHRKPSVNIKVIWEGEEERSSPHLEAILTANRDLLAADLWLIGDAPIHQSRTPMIYFGARGSLGLEATVYGPARALHDGHYGNWAPNPAARAAQLITELRGPDGAVRIPGFLKEVRAPTAAEKAAIAALPPVEASLKTEFGIGAPEGAEGLTASTMRPALNIRGIRAGQVGAAAANAIPTEAQISIDFRLVPDQTPTAVRNALEAYLNSRGWKVVTGGPPDLATRAANAKLIRLEWEDGYPGLRSDMSSPEGKAVIAAASRAAGRPVAVLPMMGASVPIDMFDAVFKKPIIGLPIVAHDNNQHAANENARLKNLWDGVEAYAAMMADLNW